jgi:hypothetical protein
MYTAHNYRSPKRAKRAKRGRTAGSKARAKAKIQIIKCDVCGYDCSNQKELQRHRQYPEFCLQKRCKECDGNESYCDSIRTKSRSCSNCTTSDRDCDGPEIWREAQARGKEAKERRDSESELACRCLHCGLHFPNAKSQKKHLTICLGSRCTPCQEAKAPCNSVYCRTQPCSYCKTQNLGAYCDSGQLWLNRKHLNNIKI